MNRRETVSGVLSDRFWGNYYFVLDDGRCLVATPWEMCRNGTTDSRMILGNTFWIALNEDGSVYMVSWKPLSGGM